MDEPDARHFLHPAELSQRRDAFSEERLGKLNARIEETERGGVSVKAHNYPLAVLLSHGLIDPHHFYAGVTLARLANQSRKLSCHVQFRYEETRGGGSVDRDLLLKVPRDLLEVLAAIRSLKHRRKVEDVAIYGFKAGRGGVRTLKEGLDDVHHFYERLRKNNSSAN